MRTTWPITNYVDSDFHREVRAHVASAEARRVERGGARRAGFLRTPGGFLRWPVAVRRSIADGRLRRERTFWLAVARTSR